MNSMLVGGNGEVGSNSHKVYMTLFPDGFEYENAGDFELLLKNLVSGKYSKIVLPLYNSLIGDVIPALDALNKVISDDISLKEENKYDCLINHALIGGSNADIEKINTIYGYPVATDQCRKVLDVMNANEVFYPDTYGAVVDVVQRNLENEAAVGPQESAEKLGGKVLMDNVSDDSNNITTFKVYSLAQS